MIGARVTKDRYTIDPLYQWDKNQVLQIYGLSLPSIPEIHFSNKTMNNAIVKQASMDKAGVVTVDIPNSLLEQSHDIIVYICTYEGDAFKCLYKMIIPVYPKKKPDDYITPPDNTDEVYSYNALENLFVNAIALSIDNYEKAKADYESMSGEISKATKTLETATEALKAATGDFDFAKSELNQAKAILEDASTKYDAADDRLVEATNGYNQAVDNYNAALQAYEDAVEVFTQAATTEYVDNAIADAMSNVKVTSARNLLDNSDFTKPVNQRGLTSLVANGSQYQYFLDRWLHVDFSGASVTFTLTDNGVAVTNGTGFFYQRYEKGHLKDGVAYTLAVYYADGTVDVRQKVYPAFVVSCANESYDQLYFTVDSGKTVSKVAMYEGVYTIDSLPDYQPKGYGAELAECYRYYYKGNNNMGLFYPAAYIGTNGIYFVLSLPAKMRTLKPSVSAVTMRVVSLPAYAVQDGFTFDFTFDGGNQLRVAATKTAHGLSQCMFEINQIEISADL